MLVYGWQRPEGAGAVLLAVKARVLAWLTLLSPALAAWAAANVPPFRAPLITDPGVDAGRLSVLPREALLRAIADARAVRATHGAGAEGARRPPLLGKIADLTCMERSVLRSQERPCASTA